MKELLCYVYGYDGNWQAICIDLDIAIAGKSRAEVERGLVSAVNSYVDAAMREAPADQERLLRRRAPLHVRVGFWLWLQFHMLRRRHEHKSALAVIGLPCPA